MARVKPSKQKTNNRANVGYEAELWQMADALRGSMDGFLAGAPVIVFDLGGERQLSMTSFIIAKCRGWRNCWRAICES
ncbi:MAG: hypothetical protein HYY82_00090 [Deltaproteobacteria bacterium]|nr:hypothetical protein [Deltaproteobacteria bacterium]